MKNMKKIASLLLALVMVFSLAVTAYADDNVEEPTETTAPTTPEATVRTPGTITITNALKGETYNLYMLFDFTWDGDKAYTYTLPENSPWEDFFTNGAGKTYFTMDANTRIMTATKELGTTNNGTGARAFADAAMAYIAQNPDTVIALQTITPDGNYTYDAEKKTTSITFDGLTYGYYLIDTTMGTVCVIDSNSTDLTLTDKTTVPHADKQVKEDDAETGAEWKDDYATAAIGQTVSFRTIIQNVYKRENLVYHDKMSEGLTLNADSIKVYMRPETGGDQKYLNKDTDYTVNIPGEEHEECTFEVVISNDYLKTLSSSTAYLVVEYTAEVNEKAEITDPVAGQNLAEGGNPNFSGISYGQDQWSDWDDKVTVHTWPLKVFKFTKNGDKTVPLAGAEFVLAKPVVSEGKTYWAYVKAVDDNNVPLPGTADGVDQYDFANAKGWVMSKVDAETGIAPVPKEALRFVSSDVDNVLIEINGLDSPDEYVLIETKAPDGYNMIDEPIHFTINMNGNTGTVGYIIISQQTGLKSQIEVENKSGTELPSTGGMGTTLIYTLGGIMVLAAVVLLVTKKRMTMN